MENVIVGKDDLISRIKQNKEKHLAEYKETREKYKWKMAGLLQDLVEEVKSGKLADLSLIYHYPAPQEYLSEYDTALTMLEMSVDDTITLSEEDFKKFVMDDWNWKKSFSASNTFYSVG